MEAASAASAQPSVSTRTKCFGLARAAADAITGMCVASRDRLRQRAIEAGLHAVGIHGGQQNFAGAELFAARGPSTASIPSSSRAAARVDVPARRPARRASMASTTACAPNSSLSSRDQFRTAHRRRVDADLVRARQQNPARIGDASGCRRPPRAG